MSESRQENELAAHQAAVWQARLSSDQVTRQQRREFALWMAEKPENRQAWDEMHTFWLGLDNLTEADISGETDCLDDQLTDPGETANKKPPAISWSFKPMLGIAATLLLSASLIYTQVDYWLADQKTESGQIHTIQLADGSHIVMNSETALSVDYTGDRRQIALYRGEAYFEVAADPSRPFLVQTGAGSIQSLGTQFDVKTLNDSVAVTVFEHAVRVTLNNGQLMQRLPAGKQLVFNQNRIDSPLEINLSHVRSWRDRQIIFQDKPLAEVIEELNRYRAGLIVIIDSDIKNLPVTGVFSTDNTDIALQTIEETLSVKIRKLTEKLVLISSG